MLRAGADHVIDHLAYNRRPRATPTQTDSDIIKRHALIRNSIESTVRIGKSLLLFVVLGLAVGCSDEIPTPGTEAAQVEVIDAVSHPSAGAPVGVVYLRAINLGAREERLVGVSSSISEAAELHETVADGNMMRMIHRKEGFEFAPNTELTLAPGGKHIMLTGLAKKLEAGDSFVLDLVFERAGRVGVEVPVRPRAH